MNKFELEFQLSLTDDNVMDKVKDLIDEIGLTNYTNSDQTMRMFVLNNFIWKSELEHNRTCCQCRKRVYNKLKNYIC